ncbi:MAG: DUF348 domain-containing protein [Chloroflexi bacterium]|nr:DUF348 domain-containing protein [Chloroflexota bacterium]
MQIKYIRSLAIVIILAGLTLIAFNTRKTVTVIADGEENSISTFALTVGGALRSAGVSSAPEDEVQPSTETRLADGMIVRVNRAVLVYITADGQKQTLKTAERRPANLLALADIQIYPGDRILYSGARIVPDESLPEAPSYHIQLQRSVEVELIFAGGRRVFASSSATLAGALWDAGITLYAADHLDPAPETPLTGPITATLVRAKFLEITIGDQVISTRSAASTVGQALAEAGFAMQGLDFSQPLESDPLPEDGQIRVVRVREQVVIQQEPLPFDNLLQPVADQPIDTLTIIQPGEYGLTAQRLRVRYEDGIEVSRQVEDEWVAREPIPRIQGYGTQISVQTMQTPDGPIEYWRALEFYATSYSPSRSGTDPEAPWYGQVYCGGEMENGMVGVDLSYVPCFTPLYIPGYGFAVAMDTGNIDGAWIDLGYLDDDFVPWYQYVTVYFLTPVPALENIAWIIPPGTFR